MCGIAGLVVSRAHAVDVAAALGAMRDALAHRGPDGEGTFRSPDGRVGLANRRLAVVDLSPAAAMPMRNASGTVWITYNGEIYNAVTLRAELEACGAIFRSASDTEVILHGYETWGIEVVERLRGMFAFAIYDAREWPRGPQRLLLARDRLGIKPLYCAALPEAFAFASELKALQASGVVPGALSPAGLVGYLLFGSVPAPVTIYDGIQALEPGCVLRLAVDGSTTSLPQIQRYWSFPPPAEPAAPIRDPVGEVRALLDDAVRSHLASDVPLGAFLSGGLDSSAVVTLMRAAYSGPIRTCSMVFEEAEYSEAPYARAVARAVGAEHHERVVTADEVRKELEHVLGAMDQPTIDGVNTYFVAQTARQAGLKVALSGLGGDELFGGYSNTFQGVPLVWRAVRAAQRAPGGARLTQAGLRAVASGSRWLKVAEALARPASAASAYLACRGLFTPNEVRSLVGPELWAAASATFDPLRVINEAVGGGGDVGDGWRPTCEGAFGWVSRAELGLYTRHQLLRDTDVMSMAHGLEVRVPLLDHVLVEGVLRLPPTVHRKGVRPKALLLAALGDRLPAPIRARRAKQGFTFPFAEWLRGPLRETCAEWDRGLAGLLRPEAVAAVEQAWAAGRAHWSRPWALAALGGWRSAARPVVGSLWA
jgi:asparagine synthase (glutamine-hydrolysing)